MFDPRSPRRIVCAVALAGFVLPLAAQERSDAVVVRGPRPDNPSLAQPNIETARHRIEQIPGGANVIDADDYREARVSTLADALGFSPGVIAQPRFGAEETRLSIRGSGVQRTFHLRGLRLMQDGVPLNLADGSGDFQAIEPLNTRYIEVYRGANALQYGASNLGGAINYVSTTGYDSPAFSGRIEAGSFDYLRKHASTGGVSGALDWYAAISTFDQDGFRRHAKQSAQRFSGHAGFRVSADLDTRFYVSLANSDSQLPGNITKRQLEADPRQANAANVTGNQKRDIDWVRLSNRTVWKFGESRLELMAWFNDKTLFHPIFQVLDQKNRDAGAELRWVGESRLMGRRNILTAGISPTRGTTAEDRWVNNGGNRGARTNKFDQVASNLEMYLENQHYVTPQTALVAGVQHSRNRRVNSDRFIAAGEGDESFSLRYSGTSPKLGLRHELRPGVQVYGNVSRSYEPPSFGEITGGLRPIFNRAQKGTTVEVGSRGDLPDLNWDVAVYRARLRDELLQTSVFIAGNAAAAAAQTVNADRTIHQGLELGLGGRFLGRWTWRTAMTLQELRFDGDPVYGDGRLPGLPEAFVRAELLYRGNDGWFAGVNLESSLKRYPVDFTNSFFAESYAILGAKLGRRIDSRLSWFAELRNLANTRYAATTNVVRNQAGADGALFLPGDGRSFYAGIQWDMEQPRR